MFNVLLLHTNYKGGGMPEVAVKESELTTTVFRAKSGVSVNVCQTCDYYQGYRKPVLDFGNFHRIIGACSFSLNYSAHKIGGGEVRAECGRI